MRKILETGQYFNRSLIKNNRFAAGAIFYTQVITILVHGFFVRSQSTLPTSIELPELLTVTGIALLILVGFGLVFSPAKNNLWSSIGFTFFILTLTFQIYDLSNAFWTYSKISPFNDTLVWGQQIPVYLSDRNSAIINTYGNTAVGALKCGLANSIAFAAILGRAGLLEAFVMTIVGTVVYELNRQIVIRNALDFGGSMSIFCWGGVYGSVVSLILYFRKHKLTAQQNELRRGGKYSYTLASIGSLFCWVFFPFLNWDIPVQFIFSNQAAINTLYCITASVITCACISCLFYGQMSLKDVVYSPVVGGVIVGSSAAMINNTAGALILGMVAGIVHTLLQRWQKIIKWYFLIQNNVLFLFGVQGMLGGLFSSIFIQIATIYSPQLYSTTSAPYALRQTSGALVATGTSIAIAFLTGIVVGAILNLMNKDIKTDHYHDRAYWIIQQDCISIEQDIHLETSTKQREEESQDFASDESETNVEVYKEVVIRPERDFKNKFVQL